MRPSHASLPLLLSTLALWTLACSGAGTAPAEPSLPTWPAEPLALVDLPGDERPTDVVFLPDGTLAVSTSSATRPEGGTLQPVRAVRFRDVHGGAGAFADTPPIENEEAGPLARSPDGARFARVRYDSVDLVPIAGGPITTLPLRDPGRSADALLGACNAPWQVVWGGTTLAVRCAIGPPVLLANVETGARSVAVPRADTDGADIAVYDLDVHGDTLVVIGASGEYADPHPWVQLQDLATGAVRQRFPLQRRFEDVALSPDGRKLAVSHPYFGLQLLDAADGHVLADYTYTPDLYDRGSGDVRWTADGHVLRVGRRLGVAVHDGTDATLLGYLPAHPDEPVPDMPLPDDWPRSLSSRNGTLALSPDGHILASIERTDFGRAVRTWRLPDSAH